MRLLTVIFFLVVSASTTAQLKQVSIVQFGAIGDGKTLNTAGIQKAIDQIASKGGGTVQIPKGVFVTGSIFLRSNIILELLPGSVLMGSPNRLDYGQSPCDAMINAIEVSNIAIKGTGIIDGNAKQVLQSLFDELKSGRLTDRDWPKKRPTESNRPKIIHFFKSKKINISTVSIQNGCTWIQSYERCDQVNIKGIKVNSTSYWNNDGLDIVDSKNVLIENCTINSSDDAICLKSESAELDSVVNVKVLNCSLRSSANAFKIGTGSRGGFKNIYVKGLIIYDTYRSAIALEAVDGAFLKNITIEGVRARNTGNGIFVKLGKRNKDERFSTVQDITIRNVSVQIPAGKPDKGYELEGPLLKYPPGIKPGDQLSISPWNKAPDDKASIEYLHHVFPASISGLPDHPVKNIKLENIELSYEGRNDASIPYFPIDSLHLITEAVTAYPEFSMFGELPCWGFYFRHVDGLSIKNLRLFQKNKEPGIAVVYDDVNYLNFEDINVPNTERVYRNVKRK